VAGRRLVGAPPPCGEAPTGAAAAEHLDVPLGGRIESIQEVSVAHGAAAQQHPHHLVGERVSRSQALAGSHDGGGAVR